MIIRANETNETEAPEGPYRTAAKCPKNAMEMNIRNMEEKVDDISTMLKTLGPEADQFREFVKKVESRFQGAGLEDQFEAESLGWGVGPAGQGHFYIKKGLVGGWLLRDASNIELLRFVDDFHALLNKMQANISYHFNEWEGHS